MDRSGGRRDDHGEPLTTAEALAMAQRWAAAEPDTDIRAELLELMNGGGDILAARMSGRLEFGTAGLRAAIGAGPQRMNRLVVRQAAAGLGRYLLDTAPDAATKGVVIGFDARRKSDDFAADSARVFAAMGIRVLLFDRPVPTPIVPFTLLSHGASAGVVVTASHNPPADNGYKVYLGNGAQIVPPQDAEISERIAAVDPTSVELVETLDIYSHPLVERLDDEAIEAYIEHAALVRRSPEVAGVRVAYSALHGVGGAILHKIFAKADLPAPVTVDQQQTPDGTFPTVSFPNPEEPGAMDLVIDAARTAGVAVALANDPDADRLGVAIAQPNGDWRRLTGDEIGWLLADYLLATTHGDDRLVITTLVSSSLLARMAAAAGVEVVETLTGFKWIAAAAHQRPDRRLIFAYEQALGYLVGSTTAGSELGTTPVDKDGLTAAVAFAELVAVTAQEGRTIQDRLEDIALRFGRHVVSDASVRVDPQVGVTRLEALRRNPPTALADRRVVGVEDFPAAHLLRIELDGDVRVQVRPSGTEPKIKVYGEGVDIEPSPYVAALVALLT